MTDSGTPPRPFDATPPPVTHVEPEESPPASRPAWFAWAVGAGIVAIAVGAFFVTKAVAGGGSSPAAASTGNSNSNAGNGSSFQSRFPGASGRITAIDGSTLTLQDRQNRSVKVTTTGGTRVTLEKTVAVSDIAKGDRISVTGKRSGTTIAATRVAIADLQATAPDGNGAQGGATPGYGPQGFGPNGFGGRQRGEGPPVTDANGNPTGVAPDVTNGRTRGDFAFGTVTSIVGDKITISGFDGSSITVTTTSSTTVTKNVPGSFSDLEVGQNVRAIGTTGSDGTVAATSISEGADGFAAFGGSRGGPPAQGTP